MKRSSLVSVLFLVACGGGESSTDEQDPIASAWDAQSLAIEVDYVSGAAPYTGQAGPVDDVWDLSQLNLERLFAGKAVVMPHTVQDMEELVDVGPGPYSAQDIFEIAELYRDAPETPGFYALWLDGYYEQGGEVLDRVLGVALGGTSVIAMFKPTIVASGAGRGERVQRFVEQVTLIHEIGHAAGLVDNGLELTSDHHDDENAGHCSNPNCVMYYLNEGAADLADFVDQYLTSGETVVFDSACLGDADAANATF